MIAFKSLCANPFYIYVYWTMICFYVCHLVL